MRVFLICPVRDVIPEERAEIAAYVAAQEAMGRRVYWPARDTPQDGDGFDICAANRAGMEPADEVHVWWSVKSEGSRFDLGMAFALRKPIRLARPVAATAGKSFNNVLRALAGAKDDRHG
jgi:hypothetical protein